MVYIPYAYFKISEGGWINPGGGPQGRDPYLHRGANDVHAVTNPGDYGAQEKFVFQKNLSSADVLFICDAVVGSIITVSGANLIDGETFTLDDGTNPAVTFEFDSGALAATGSITTPVGSLIEDTETFVLDDGTNPAVTFEFDKGAIAATGSITTPDGSALLDSE